MRHKYLQFLFLFIALLIAGHQDAGAQCCSPGNPTGGTANQGTLKKGAFRGILFFQHAASNQNFEGSKPVETDWLKNADYNFTGLNLAWGALNRLTLEAETGYFFNRTVRYIAEPPYDRHNGAGLSDIFLHAKVGVWKDPGRQWELTLGAGIGIPSRRNEALDENGIELPRDVQTSTNAQSYVGHLFLYKGFIERKMHFFLVSRATFPGKSKSRYQFGESLITSLFFSRVLSPDWSLIAQIRNEHRWQDHQSDVLIVNTGGNLLYFCPQVNYIINQKWNVSLLFDIPVYRHYNNQQLGKAYNLTLLFGRVFGQEKMKIGTL